MHHVEFTGFQLVGHVAGQQGLLEADDAVSLVQCGTFCSFEEVAGGWVPRFSARVRWCSEARRKH